MSVGLVYIAESWAFVPKPERRLVRGLFSVVGFGYV